MKNMEKNERGGKIVLELLVFFFYHPKNHWNLQNGGV